ncbi:MAG: twin-arginine translocase subunit TatC [Pseudomonadota bacterium]|nr:twin-arginine translocase subunit TatC [Pseudomonadota bacterium]
MFDEAVLGYWQEFRFRISLCLGWFLGCFCLSYAYSNWLYSLITWPVSSILSSSFVVLSLVDTLTTPLRLSWYVAWFMTVPLFFYQMGAFVWPAMYKQERRLCLTVLLLAIALYYFGTLFALGVMSPFLVYYIKAILPPSVTYMPDMKLYIDFMIYLSMCFGWVFELPLAMMFLVYFNWCSRQKLASFRRYFIIIAFIVGMVLTPPDVLSQCLLAIPLCLVYEFGLLILYLAHRFGLFRSVRGLQSHDKLQIIQQV